MSTISEHIEIIEQVSTDALEHLLGEQWSVERFVFCGVEKINKIIKAAKVLYPQMQEDRDLEFSCGILLRSLLMDCILTLPIKDLSFKKGDKTFEALRADIADYCLKVIGDGTNHLINDAFKIEGKTREEQLKISENLANLFHGMFETEANQKPKLKKAYKVTLASLVEDSNHEALITKDSIYQLYSFYSKYDHLSHWTSLSGKMPFSKRMDKIDISIILTLFNLRDLLSNGYDFGNNLKGLDKYCQLLQEHLNHHYSPHVEP